MISESTVYWITRMGRFHGWAIALGVIFTILYIIALIVGGCIWQDDKNRRPFCLIFPTFIIPLIFVVGSVFIPTTKEMCAIKGIPMIVNNKGVQELPNKIVDLANEWMEELRPTKENN